MTARPCPTRQSAAASHTYPTAGTYTVTVTARNTSGLTGTASGSVVVAAPPPPVQPPSASLVMTPANGTAPLSVTADASASSDPQGQALTYAFDFGDGTTLPAQSAPPRRTCTPSVGTFTATVTVRNASGLSTPTTATVVTTAPAVQPPAASLTVTPASGAAPLALIADASASSDPQGQALSYAFDFGDGTTVPSSATATADHTYTAAGQLHRDGHRHQRVRPQRHHRPDRVRHDATAAGAAAGRVARRDPDQRDRTR